MWCNEGGLDQLKLMEAFVWYQKEAPIMMAGSDQAVDEDNSRVLMEDRVETFMVAR